MVTTQSYGISAALAGAGLGFFAGVKFTSALMAANRGLHLAPIVYPTGLEGMAPWGHA